MLKKRLIGVITVKGGWAVQSFGYRRYLPLGKPECLVENLDRWGADEILVQVIDRSVAGLGPDFKLLERLGALGLGTPLIYAGGIRSAADGVRLIQSGADRIVVDALLREDLSAVSGLSERLGAQALIASLPLSWQENALMWLDYRTRLSLPISDAVLETIQSGVVSEVMISDWRHEGHFGGFEQKLVDEFPLKGGPIIAFGGLSELAQIRGLLQSPAVVAVAVGNFLSYREHAIQNFKVALAGMPLRLATYESTFPLIADV
jgi:cyclase